MIHSIIYENSVIEFKVEYRNRKTLSIEIKPPNNILVISPKGVGIDRLNAPNNILVISPKGVGIDRLKEVVRSKGKWILNKINEFEDVICVEKKAEFKNGEFLMYLGKEYPIEILMDNTLKYPKIKFEADSFKITTNILDEEIIREAMTTWYKCQCRDIILKRIEIYKKKVGKKYRNMKVKDQKNKWGSCSSKGDMLFNWKLIMAPIEVIDYVVVHEMSHLVHMNHSKEFWGFVSNILSDYENQKLWLRNNGMRLNF